MKLAAALPYGRASVSGVSVHDEVLLTRRRDRKGALLRALMEPRDE